VLTYTVTGLTNGQGYYFAVTALNAVGESDKSNEVSAIPCTVPLAPQNLQATAGNQQVTLTWQAPGSDGGSSITGYKVYWGTVSGSYTDVQEVGNVLTYTVTGLTNGQGYYFAVTALNAVGESDKSNEVSAIPCTVPSAPQNLQSTAGNQQVTLTWQAPGSDGGSSITGYKVYWGTVSGSYTHVQEVGNVLTYTVTGLTNGQRYYFAVTAFNAVGESDKSNEVSAIPCTVPSAPQNLQARAGNGSVTLIWEPSGDNGGLPISNYIIYYGTSQGDYTKTINLGNITSYTITGLTNGQRYYFAVSAINGVGESGKSREVSAVPCTLPSAPRNLKGIGGNGKITLSWEAPENDGGSAITGYRIYWGSTSGNYTESKEVGNVLTHTITGLTNGQTYYFAVSAINEAGEGEISMETLALPCSTPSPPENLETVAGDGKVILTWQPPTSDGGSPIIGYYVYWWSSNQEYSGKSDIIDGLTYTVTNLTNGREYSFAVSAINVAGESQLSARVHAVPFTVPSAPRNLTGIIGNGELTLIWEPPDDDGGNTIWGYMIYWGTTSRNYTSAQFVGKIHTYKITGLTNGQPYYFAVSALNDAGEGEKSTERVAIPCTVPSPPQNLRVVSTFVENGEVTLVWDKPSSDGGSPITGYIIYWSADGCASTHTIIIGPEESYTIRGLQPMKIYHFRVSAINSAGESEASPEISAPSVDKDVCIKYWVSVTIYIILCAVIIYASRKSLSTTK